MNKLKSRSFPTYLVFLAVIWGLSFLGDGVKTLSATEDKGPKNVTKEIPVVVTPIRKMLFEDIVEITGNLEAKHFSVVSALISGIIDDIYVDEGDRVVAGKTRLFQIDKVNLEQALEIAKQGVEVAVWALKAREATVTRIEADLKKAEIDYKRFKRLYENEKAVTLAAVEAQESRYGQLVAALAEARAAVNLAERQKEQAEKNRKIAAKNLSDSLATAPLSGRISERFHEPGEMVQRGDSVVRIEDLSRLEIAALLPEAFYHRVVPGDTLMQVVVAGRAIGEFPITYKSPTIDSRLRNFIIKAIVTNPPAGVVPGAMARIGVVLDQHEGIGVPQEAILIRASGRIIFIRDGNKAKAVPVTTGLSTDGWVEIFSDQITRDKPVIIMGQDMLNDGSPVTVVEEEGRR